MKAIKYEKDSVLIQDGSIKAWVDIWVENNDVVCDWNKNDFFVSDSKELVTKKCQDNLEHFEEAINIGVEVLENKGILYQDKKAKWHHTELYRITKGTINLF